MNFRSSHSRGTREPAKRAREREAREDASDVAIALRRLKDPNRKTIPLSQLKAELGLGHISARHKA
jgi:hypothetical protein